MELARKCGARFIALVEYDSPETFMLMDNPPPLLSAKGSATVFGLPTAAIVSARNAFLAGIKIA